jgi:hypothetical protein
MNTNPSPPKSKAPAILAGCGCLSALAGLALLAAAWFAGESGLKLPGVSPQMATYTNTREGRIGNLAESYVDFTFEYPKSWTMKEDAEGINFITVERSVDEQTWENLNVGYFKTAGSTEDNRQLYAPLIAQLQSQFSRQFPTLRKVSEGPVTVGEYDAYEGLFASTVDADGSEIAVYTRAILLPTPDGSKGVTLLMMGTSFHPELKAPEDLGRKGELPAVLASFRFTE